MERMKKFMFSVKYIYFVSQKIFIIFKFNTNYLIRFSLLSGSLLIFGFIGLNDKMSNPFNSNRTEKIYYSKPDYANKSIIFYYEEVPHTIREI